MGQIKHFPINVYCSNTLVYIINLISAGVGIVLVPYSMSKVMAHGVVYKSLIGISEKANMAVAHSTSVASPAINNFMHCTEQEISLEQSN